MEIIGGLILLLAGGDSLVRGSITIARRLGVSELMIGLVLVGFGTSTPELVTSLKAAFSGSPGIAVGNVVGSNIANILLILGVSAIICPICCKPGAIRRDSIILFASAVSFIVLALLGHLGRIEGLIFIVLLFSYVTYTYSKEKTGGSGHEHLEEHVSSNLTVSILLAVFGIAMTIFGANLLVEGAIKLARDFNISEATIGLTIVAVGTSLPELATSIIAALHKKSDLSLGNILGSNIFNIWFILGATALVKPIAVPESIVQFDIWAMLAASLLLIGVTLGYKKISRIIGILFLLFYGGYITAIM